MDNSTTCPFSIFGNIDISCNELNAIYSNGFNLKLGKDIYFYGLCEGYGNDKTYLFLKDKIVSKICTTFNAQMTDIEIKNLLYQTFLSIENSLINDSNLLEYKKSGIAVIVLLLVENKIFIANTGPNRGILCRLDDEYIHHIDKLNSDHSLNSTEELGRISGLGIDLTKFKTLASEICPLNSLRIIGDRDLKLNFKCHSLLGKLTSSPWSASPYVAGPVVADESAQLIILFTAGLLEALQQCGDVNKYLCTVILEFLGKHKNINETIKALTAEITNHCQSKDNNLNYFFKSTGLLICCLNKDLIGKNVPQQDNVLNSLQPPAINRPKALTIEIPKTNNLSQNLINWQPFSSESISTNMSVFTKTSSETNQSTSTVSDEINSFQRIPPKLNEKGQIESYVDFSEFNKFIAEKFNGQIENINIEEYFFS